MNQILRGVFHSETRLCPYCGEGEGGGWRGLIRRFIRQRRRARVRAERWREARGCYEQSLNLWHELQSREQLSAGEVKLLDAPVQHLAACDAELARLND